MITFKGETFGYFSDYSTGRTYSDIEFVNCRFHPPGFSAIRLPAEPGLDLVGRRSIARNIRFKNCQADGVGFIGPGIVEDSVIDGMKVTNHVQTKGTVFKHVVIKGKVDKLMITQNVDIFSKSPWVQRAFDDANEKYYESVDWAIDISEASFKDCDIRQLPTRLIRRDPETQMVITREKAMEGTWRDIDLSETHWRISIEHFLDEGSHDLVMVASKRARNFRKLLDGLKKLRDAGIVETN